MDDLRFSLEMRDIVNSLVRDAIEKERPKFRYATVKAIDNTNGKCTITYNGETSQVIVNMGVIRPTVVGQIVRIEGIGTDKFVADVIGGPPAIGQLSAVGAVTQFAGDTAPAGWLLCQGQAVSRTTYAQLYATIGTKYGTGDGSTTFNLPNLKGRVPVGTDAGQTEFATTGKTGGEKTHTLTSAEMPGHTHTGTTDSVGNHEHVASAVVIVPGTNAANGTQWGADRMDSHWNNINNNTPNALDSYGAGTSYSGQTGAHSHTFTSASTGGNGSHNNLQPYLTMNFIIKI